MYVCTYVDIINALKHDYFMCLKPYTYIQHTYKLHKSTQIYYYNELVKLITISYRILRGGKLSQLEINNHRKNFAVAASFVM